VEVCAAKDVGILAVYVGLRWPVVCVASSHLVAEVGVMPTQALVHRSVAQSFNGQEVNEREKMRRGVMASHLFLLCEVVEIVGSFDIRTHVEAVRDRRRREWRRMGDSKLPIRGLC
jgi:hypothetical protein